MFHKIVEIKLKNEYIIVAKFETGEIKEYNMKNLIEKYDIFKDLKYNNLFNLAKIDKGGHGIVWNDDIDLSSEEIWKNGIIL